MNTANTNLTQIQAAADRCTAQRGAARTAQIIDDAAELGLSDIQLVTALDAGTTAAARPWYDAPSVQSLIRAARLTDAERGLLDARLHAERLCITTPAELRAFLQDLARARAAARCAKLLPLPESELAEVAALSGNLARAERAAAIQERDHAIHIGAEVVTAKPVEIIPAQTPDPNIIPNNDDLQDDPDRTLDLPSEVVLPSRPDITIPARPTHPALPGKGGQAHSAQGKLARAKDTLKAAEKKAAHMGRAKTTAFGAALVADGFKCVWSESARQTWTMLDFGAGISARADVNGDRMDLEVRDSKAGDVSRIVYAFSCGENKVTWGASGHTTGQDVQRDAAISRYAEDLARKLSRAAHIAQPERTVVVAGDVAWVESTDGTTRYRVDFENDIPVHCGCRDPRASFGGCKHADAAAECRALDGDGTYKGVIPTKPNPLARRQHQPSL